MVVVEGYKLERQVWNMTTCVVVAVVVEHDDMRARVGREGRGRREPLHTLQPSHTRHAAGAGSDAEAQRRAALQGLCP